MGKHIYFVAENTPKDKRIQKDTRTFKEKEREIRAKNKIQKDTRTFKEKERDDRRMERDLIVAFQI